MSTDGFDVVGTTYLEQIIQMAKGLELFGQNKEEESPATPKARIFTACALFSWQAMFDRSLHVLYTSSQATSRDSVAGPNEPIGMVWRNLGTIPTQSNINPF